MLNAFSFILGELCERCPSFEKSLSNQIDEIAEKQLKYLEDIDKYIQHKRQASKHLERLIWKLINRRSSYRTLRNYPAINQVIKRSREKRIIDISLEIKTTLLVWGLPPM